MSANEETMRIDPTKQDQFVEHAMGDIKGGFMMLMAHIGDRLGLFRALSEGPMNSRELADTLKLEERYVREWLAAMTCGGYLEHDPATGTFHMPPEHAAVLSAPESPVFFGGMYQQMPGLWAIMPELTKSFRHGGGVNLAAYGQDWWDGMERVTGAWFENFLLQAWIPQAGLQSQLEAGAHIADIGCGKGRALIKLARQFPALTGVGYDLSDHNLEEAKRLAAEAGVDDRIQFARRDVHDGLPEPFDVVLTFDAAHDFQDPQQAFEVIHDGLREGGTYLIVEYRVGERLEQNIGPIGAVFFSLSVSYCMTTSLAMNGQGLGTCGLPETTIRKMADRAGFSEVTALPFEHPFNKVYAARKGVA